MLRVPCARVRAASPNLWHTVTTVSVMARQCTRQGCVHSATVTLTYQYARSLVWLDDLSPERDPHSYDLCDQHANRLTAPSGWHLEDRRQRVHVYSPGRLAG
jgi:hypothetical protein